jgi:hypothetical protein
MSATPNLNISSADEAFLFGAAASATNPTTMSAAEYIGTLFASDDLICIMTLRKGEKPKHLFATVD